MRERRSAWVSWCGFALLLLAAPLLWGSSLGLNLLTQVGITMLACLSLNVLLGHSGLLSFGHAIYVGAGAYAAIHTLNRLGGVMPVSLAPLLGGVAGAALALLLAVVQARRGGATFAMISLGLGELVHAAAAMFPAVFGGESGLSANRVVGAPVAGISFGPAWQVYALVAVYVFAGVMGLWWLRSTPLGQLLAASREGSERVEFLGVSAQALRLRALLLAGFVAGVSGALGALHSELVSAEVFSAQRSGALLLFTVLGGTAVLGGPLLGAVLMVGAQNLLPLWTPAWLLYLGLLFMAVVMAAPEGLGGVALRVVRAGRVGGLRLRDHAVACAAWALLMLGGVVLIEMTYHLQFAADAAAPRTVLGLALRVHSALDWTLAAGVLLVGALGVWWAAHRRHRTLREAP
ncbi:MAG: hypothetical protein RJA98_4161 [Pseudomonadota bacterium]|jgi:branched-chain amino acid transport system permease protein